jgi:Raf kinase inhibitor-like YbhB/YbcL family protein
MTRSTLALSFGFVFALAGLTAGCSDSGGGTPGTGGSGGSGSGGSAGTTGSGGSGTAGTTGSGGSGGGTAGSGGSGSGGTAGSGSGGNAGSGSGGNAGSGSGGNAGSGGGAGGRGGNAGGSGGAGGGAGGRGGNAGGGGGNAGRGGTGGGGGAATGFTLTSTAFDNQAGCGPGTAASMCDVFPRENTNFGTAPNQNISPPLAWTGAPAGTMSYAIAFIDLTNNNFVHWVLWNIPASVTSLAAGIDRTTAMPNPPGGGAQQASAGSGANDHGFFGSGACGNVYEFTIYALSVPTFSPTSATNQTMVRTQLVGLGNQILGMATLRARSYMPNCP